MKPKKVLLVFAHPDDELICGWPLLQDAAWHKEVLICSSDVANKDRKWCNHRKEALFALCASLGIPCRCLDFNSDFFKTPHRPPRRRGGIRRLLPKAVPPYYLGDVCRTILDAIRQSDCDALCTHNFWGEYGHLDHILLNRLVFDNLAKPVFVTDIRMQVDWLPLPGNAPLHEAVLARHLVTSCRLDSDFYAQCETYYRDAKVWTWSEKPVAETNLYLYEPGKF